MQRLLLVFLVTTGAISLSGCGFFNRNSDVVEESATPVEQSAPPVVTAEGDLPNLPDGVDSEIVVPGSANSPTVIARDLIQSTNPNERAIGVERTRIDPFAELTIPAVPPQPIVRPDAVRASSNSSSRASTSSGSNNSRVASQPNNAARSSSSSTGGTSASSPTASSSNGSGGAPLVRPSLATPQPLPTQPAIAALPAIPQPTTARAVRVSGVIDIGGSPYAIVQAPNDIERYVRPGDDLAGGRVLVKRIDTRSDVPSVILVENGIEVERGITAAGDAVAEEAAPSEEEASTTVSSSSVVGSLPSPAGI